MTPMRVVLDSNVIISGFLFGGVPSRLLQHVVVGAVRCFISLPILDEIRDVLQRPKFGLLPEQALGLVEEIHDLCLIVAPKERVHVIDDDPDDNTVLECAMEAGVKVVVSGDAHLLDLREWRSIRILSPRQALNEIEGMQSLSR